LRGLSAVWTNPGLLGWTLLTLLATPLALTRKIRRRRHAYEFDPKRWFIRRLDEAPANGSGPRIAFVAAGYGEFLLVKLLAKEMLSHRPDARIIYCVRDQSTLEYIREKEPNCEAAIWPFDFIYPVARWLDLYKPDLLVFSERFRFTAFSRAAKLYGSRVALINGRSRERRSAYYRLALPFYRWVFGAFDAMCFQMQEHTDAARPFVTDTLLETTGDLKIDLQPKPLSETQKQQIQSWLSTAGEAPFVSAGSTDTFDENAFVLEAYKLCRASTLCKLLLAPRLLEHVENLLPLLEDLGLTYSLRSEGVKEADVYVLDTIGELSFAYQFSVAAYVGGAFEGNGHNIVEPLQWGVPVSYGMNRGHFEHLQVSAEEAGVGTRVGTSDELAAFWLVHLRDADRRVEIKARAAAMLEPHKGALERTVAVLRRLVG
jgi:3-deoxy-D-manno-octulosonic-acid transferase